MGETGTGKTENIKLYKTLSQSTMKILNVHAGLKQEQIIDFIKSAQKYIEDTNHKKKIILFFDEINTNKNISGLLKEILIDRRFLG